MWTRIRRAMQVRQLSAGGAGLVLGLLLNVASNWLYGPGARLLPVVVAVFGVAFVASIWLWLRTPQSVVLNLRPPKVLRTPDERLREARRGLVVFVSLYNGPGMDLKKEDWTDAAARKDYLRLDLPNSNLGSTIEAIATHSSRLEHCWLIATNCIGGSQLGSHIYVPALVEYLCAERKMPRELFHCGDEYNVCLDDDALVFNKTLDVIKKVFAEAEALGLTAPDTIADLTAGVRSMTLAMVLSCLDGDRDVEMIGMHYTASGKLTDPPFPVIFGFEPVLQQG